MSTRDNQSWLKDLRSQGNLQEEALAELREIIARGLSHALVRWLKPDHPQFQSLVEESTQETMLKVLDNLDTFEGRSQFTTWVYKIGVRVALTELRRKRWQNISLDEMVENYEGNEIFPVEETHAEDHYQQKELIEKVSSIIHTQLTEKQRTVLIALGGGMALEEVAQRMGTNRNALYKLLHDARKKLKHSLNSEGLQVDEILSAFE